MYRCDDCNTDFETPKLIKDSESGDFLACPHCGKSDYYEIVECPECGKTEYVADMPLYCGMCRECFVEKYTDELGYRYFRSQNEETQKDALKYIYWIDGTLRDNAYIALLNDLINKYSESLERNLYDFYFAGDLKEWVFEDLTAFADWCGDNDVFKESKL